MRPLRHRAWDVIVPIKRLAAAKSRLHGLEGAHRQRLALSFALDAVHAARSAAGVGRVFVVTRDAHAGAALALQGARIVGERRGPGLNPAIEAGVDAALDGNQLRRIAVMTGDVPAVTPGEIDAALASAEAHPRAVLADADGTGTVLLTANPFPTDPFPTDPCADPARTPATGVQTGVKDEAMGPAGAVRRVASVRPLPRFGDGSFARHVAAGHVPLVGAHPGLRRDVDTRHDFETARLQGLGAATAAQWEGRALTGG